MSAIVFIASAYFISKKFGFSTGFKYRTSISTPAFVVQGIIGVKFTIAIYEKKANKPKTSYKNIKLFLHKGRNHRHF